MTTSNFADVVNRLKLVLDMATETALAERLGFGQSTWASRKKRGSLPRKQIDFLIATEELNPEFIYNGTGDVHVPLDGESWNTLYAKRAAVCGLTDGWLRSRGHSDAVVAELLAPRAGSRTYRTLAALRDIRLVLRVDLNWLVAADTTQPGQAAEPTPTGLSASEQRLLDAYRRAASLDKAVIERSAGL